MTIEAKNGVTVDAGSSSLKLTGGDVSITATTGLTLDGGPLGRQVNGRAARWPSSGGRRSRLN